MRYKTILGHVKFVFPFPRDFEVSGAKVKHPIYGNDVNADQKNTVSFVEYQLRLVLSCKGLKRMFPCVIFSWNFLFKKSDHYFFQ